MTNQRKQMLAGVACGVLAVVAVFIYTAAVHSDARVARAAAIESYGGERVQVCVARHDIAVGTQLSADDVELRDWLVDLLPAQGAATSLDEVVGKVARVDIKQNEALLTGRVGEGRARISVPDGLEAVSVSSDDVLAVGGALTEGSFVNVYVETAKGKIALLGKNILVLETDAPEEEAVGKGKTLTWVTLAVTPDSVTDLISASTKGTIHFVLPASQAKEEK